MLSTDALADLDTTQLPEDPGVLKQLVLQLYESLRSERAELEQLRQNFDALLRRVWGPKSEKANPNQPLLFDISPDPDVLAGLSTPVDGATDQDDEAEAPAKRRKGAHGRRRMPENIERTVVEHDLTPAEKELLGGEACLKPLEDQVTSQFEWEPASLFVIEHHQKKYAIVEPPASVPATDVLQVSTPDASQVSTPDASQDVTPDVTPDTTTDARSVGSLPVADSNDQKPAVEVSLAGSAQPESHTPNGKPPRSIPSAVERARSRAASEFKSHLQRETATFIEATIVVAPKPPQAIPGGLAGPGLLAQVIVSKYADHLPLHRLERIFVRFGMHFARSTTCGWCAGAAKLLGLLADLIRNEVLRSFVIHTDDTPVDVRTGRKKEKYQARFWTYWGDDEHPLVWFDFTKNRKRAGPDRVLKDYRGYLQADGYGGYDDYEGVELSDISPILKVACWAHARRKFRDARGSDGAMSEVALAYIRQLYVIDKKIKARVATEHKDLSWEEAARKIAEYRRAEALPVIEKFKAWLGEVTSKRCPLPKSPLAKAITYANNQWDALVRYVDDGRLELDNNKAERALRGIAIGRKNWMFVGSENGGHTAATLFTIIASAVRNGLEPYQYLRVLLEELPYLGENPTADQLRPYLPNIWRPSKV